MLTSEELREVADMLDHLNSIGGSLSYGDAAVFDSDSNEVGVITFDVVAAEYRFKGVV